MAERKMNPRSLANLKPAWKPGESPARNQTGPIFAPALRRLLTLTPGEFMRQELDRMSVAESIAWVRIYAATQLAGAAEAQWIAERVDGRVKSLEEANERPTYILQVITSGNVSIPLG